MSAAAAAADPVFTAPVLLLLLSAVDSLETRDRKTVREPGRKIGKKSNIWKGGKKLALDEQMDRQTEA